VAAQGLNFHPADEFLAQLKSVGAVATVLAAVKTAKVSADDVKPDKDLLQQLSNAGILIKEKPYYEAATELTVIRPSQTRSLDPRNSLAELC
jgi:hypothetical protein